MIACPNCNHQNPDGANQCEACYTPLPSLVACPSCGHEVQANASFCGQCGEDLRSGSKTPAPAASNREPEASPAATISSFPSGDTSSDLDSTIKTQNFLNTEEPNLPTNPASDPAIAASTPNNPPDFDIPDLIEPDPLLPMEPLSGTTSAPPQPDVAQIAPPQAEPPSAPATPAARPMVTQLQTISVRLRHVQTDTPIEFPRQLSVVRIGKPNDRTPPDIDVSGFPDSEIVSRTHANLLVEGDVYYIEDTGSSNGTYVNGLPLPAGNRHRLRPGDRIALGKGDKVSFIFEAAS